MTTTLKAADSTAEQSALADSLLQQSESILAAAWDVCDHTLNLDSALHDIRCAIDRVQQAREAIAGAARDIAVALAADSGQCVPAAVSGQQRTADTMQQELPAGAADNAD